MTLRKTEDSIVHCLHPEHMPPMHIVLDPGVYEHTCPGCGETKRFIISAIICSHKWHENPSLMILCPGCGVEY